MPAWSFLRSNFLDHQSPACVWRHPWQAARVALGAAQNGVLPLGDHFIGGGGCECPVCGWRGQRFRTFLSADEVINDCICPVCGSFDRHRQLVLGVRDKLARRNGSEPGALLGFSLSGAMRFLLEHEGLARCFRSDISVNQHRFAPDFLTDLRSAALRNDVVDWIFCSHVLEHIPEFEPCVTELVRILRPGGLAWIQVPLEQGLQKSRRIEIDPHRAHAHAWQFGLDFGALLKRPEWRIQEITAEAQLAPEQRRRFGIVAEERYWIARKSGP